MTFQVSPQPRPLSKPMLPITAKDVAVLVDWFNAAGLEDAADELEPENANAICQKWLGMSVVDAIAAIDEPEAA